MNKIPKKKVIISSLVAGVTFIVFLPAIENEFINWDDNQYVYENPFIRSFDTQLLKSAFSGVYVGNWHPLTWLSHALDFSLWGLNPLGHHLTNNVLHALNTLIVVFLVMRLMEVFRKTEENNGVSQPFLQDRAILITGAATGLLFGLHPLHVESVAWVAERKDLLCAFFYLLTIVTFTHYVSEVTTLGSTNSPSLFFNGKYLLSIGFFILSLLSKPMAVTLPLVLLILDWCLFRRMQSLKTFRTVLAEKLPFFALTLISSIVTMSAQKAGGAVMSLEDIPLASRVMVAAKSLITYLVKMTAPIHLVPFYPYPKNVSFFSLEYVMPIVIVLAITAMCIAVVRKQKLWISVWSYYVITLMPVLGIVQVGGQSMADRYAYLPSIGPLLVFGLISAKIYEKVSASNRWRVTGRMACFFIALTVLISLSYATIKQIGIWKNSIVFWNYVIEKEPARFPLAYNNLGLAYATNGLLDIAIEQYRIALRLTPDYAEAHNNLGVAYATKGQWDMAVAELKTSLRLQPDNAAAHFNLGIIYLNNGFKGMARAEIESGLKIKPDDYKARQILDSIISSER